MARPFEGIRIIDITHVLAGPFAAYQLGLMGADVIKVEHPDDPDQSRDSGTDNDLNHAGMGTGFLTQGSNKRAITLNLKTEQGREILKKLVATADVLVENYRPGAFEALGLGYEDLRKINPKLIYASFSAFGQGGPKRQRTAYDHVIQSTSGIMAMTDQDRRTGHRLRDRHDGRLCAVRGAVPAGAHRPGPARRHGDAGCGDDPDGKPRHWLSSQRQASEAVR
jgi:crotonobetainyl-CoA:carnitine CoA-transferase CaiB-like acyl-CoA transferase